MRQTVQHLILTGLLLATPAPVLAQFRLPIPRIPGLPTEVPIPPAPGLDQLLREEPPVSTSLADAQTEIPFLDGYQPRQYTPMTQLSRGENGSFRLPAPGTYQLDAQSYCLHAGTHAPGGGDGYLFAPLKGRRAEIIRRILQRSVDYPQIPQRQIQMLIWSILARARISDLSPDLQAIARQLLTTEDINRLNGGALGQIPPEVRSRLFATLPPQVRQVLNAEAEMRSLLSRGNASYAQLEQIAVLAGNGGRGEGSRNVPEGRWSYHPNGFFIRYIPSSYSRTRIQISVPGRHTVTRDNLGRITAIADRQGNRIETVYDDSIAPRPHPRDPNLQAYAFRTIRYIRPHPVQRGQFERFEMQNTGWTFVRRSNASGWNGRSVPLAAKSARAPMQLAQGDRYPGWMERSAEAFERQQQIQDYLDRLERQRRERSQQDIDDLIDLSHYGDGLEAATGNSWTRIDWIANHFQRVANAVEYATCVLEGGCNSSNSSDNDRNPNSGRIYDPSQDVAVPGNTSRQRLGLSARSYQ